MHLLAGEHAQRRRARQAIALHVPARVQQNGVARSGKAGEVRHLAAGDEADAARRRQAQQLTHPAPGGLLGDGQGRAQRVPDGVLIPGGHEPVRRYGDRQRAADDEPEVARAARHDQAGISVAHQIVDHGERVDAFVGEGPTKRRAQLVDARVGVDRARPQPAKIVVGVGHGGVEDRVSRISPRQGTAGGCCVAGWGALQ